MRLRTLPVSLAGVTAGWAPAILSGAFSIAPGVLCLLFATLAQIASNFANEYYDYRHGLDAPGRVGPRRGVTEGDITPRAMLAATYLTLGAALAVGLSLIIWGGWWLIAAGAIIAAGVVAYSAGPYPLSHHCLGEVAVVFFFGIIPVNLTFYLMTGTLCDTSVFMTSLSMGLMGANVLLVNNYRDADADADVGKQTIAVALGRPFAAALYLINGFAAPALMLPLWMSLPLWAMTIPAAYLFIHCSLYHSLTHKQGRALNPVLGKTAVTMAAYALALLAAACFAG